MSERCPYCELANKKGELFCSRHSSDMSSLESGIFFIHEKNFEECDWHITRLSLNFNFDSTQTYFAGNREYRISPEKYLLINEGQSFKTFARNHSPARMVTIAFKVGLAEELYCTLTSTTNQLLDNSYPKQGDRINFFEKTYAMDDFLKRNVLFLLQHDEIANDPDQLREKLEEMLTHLIVLQNGIQLEVSSINKVRSSTREEIYRRLHWALEYLQNYYQDDIKVDQLAAQACLSPFHFKRLFKEYFRDTPYQYIKKLRIQRSAELLSRGMPVNEACKAVGWADASSFIRLFKKVMLVTPHQYGAGSPNIHSIKK